MKLIIDIPEEDYTNIEPFLNGATIRGGFNLFKTLEIIKNGAPLDDLRTEIEELRYGQPFRKFVVDECLEIIDKYREGEHDEADN